MSHDELEQRMSSIEQTCSQKTELYHVKLEGKADAREMDRQRGNIEKLYEQQAQIRGEMNSGFADVKKQMSDTTIMLVQKLTEISGRQ